MTVHRKCWAAQALTPTKKSAALLFHLAGRVTAQELAFNRKRKGGLRRFQWRLTSAHGDRPSRSGKAGSAPAVSFSFKGACSDSHALGTESRRFESGRPAQSTLGVVQLARTSVLQKPRLVLLSDANSNPTRKCKHWLFETLNASCTLNSAGSCA